MQAVQAFRGQLKRAFDAEITPSEVLHLGSELAYSCFLPMVTLGRGFCCGGACDSVWRNQVRLRAGQTCTGPKTAQSVEQDQESAEAESGDALQSAVLLPIFAAAIWAVVSAHAESFMVLPLASIRMGLFTITTEMQGLLWEGRGAFPSIRLH